MGEKTTVMEQLQSKMQANEGQKMIESAGKIQFESKQHHGAIRGGSSGCESTICFVERPRVDLTDFRDRTMAGNRWWKR